MKKINSKNGSAAKKLIPAAGMLGISAVMLGTSTFAWFTMSKEVDVTGIKMTASVPEDIQISLGHGTGKGLKVSQAANATAATFAAANNTRTLTVANPVVDGGSTDWMNTVDISQHYTFGRITPATSATGADLFFTKDATASGNKLPEDMSASEKAIKASAAFTQAVAGSKISSASNVTSIASPYQVWTAPNSTYGTAETIADANLDATGGGYYVDIPVWFRTSITGANVELAVKATITPGPDAANGAAGSTASDPDIYKAARVALIANDNASAGVIMASGTKYYHATTGDTPTLTQSDAGYSATAGTADANNVAKTVSAFSNNASTWSKVDMVTQATIDESSGMASAGDAVVTVPKAENTTETNKYGTPVQYTLRVWLEGEDINCWNQTEGQDFRIDLQFIRKAPSA